MPPYQVASLSADQMNALESMENELGVVLVAYEPRASQGDDLDESPDEADLVLDALVDDYRTYDPQTH